MTSYGRRLVIDANFEATVGVVCQAIREAGLQALAQTDVRQHFRTHLAHDLRRYMLIDAWSPDLAFETIHLDLEAGPMFPTRFLVYELGDGETVVTATEPMAPVADEVGWREYAPAIARIADQERERIAHVFDRLTSRELRRAVVDPAA